MIKNKMTKVALAASLILMVVWLLMGTTSSIAWFQEEDHLINSLHFGDIDLRLYHKIYGQYNEVDESTEIFDGQTLFEPGYVQIEYLKIENKGTIPFTFDLSVIPDLGSTVIGTGVLGNQIDLSDYLKFGFLMGNTEEEMKSMVGTRSQAVSAAVYPLSQYTENGGVLEPGSSSYAAVIICLPENVGNPANYRGDTAPEVRFGISAIAAQLKQ